MKVLSFGTALIVAALSETLHGQGQVNYESYPFNTFAGDAGYGSADGTGSAARFLSPQAVAMDAAGNGYVADTNNHTIRKITPAGVVMTFAGLAGTSGSVDGTGSTARFFSPQGVAVDGAGNVYVADTNNHTIRKITPAGVASTLAGLAGTSGSANGTGNAARFSSPQSLTVDGPGNVYVTDTDNHTIRKITSAGVVSTLAGLAGNSGTANGSGSGARFSSPQGVAVDGANILYIADTNNHTIRRISAAGVVSNFVGSPGSPGNADGTSSSARFDSPQGLTIDSAGNLYAADFNNQTIRKITSTGLVTTVAGLAGNSGSVDGIGSAARFKFPQGVASDSAGNLLVADTNNHLIRKITTAKVVTTFAGLVAGVGSADGTGSNARFALPYGISLDNAGNLYVADANNHTIRKITPAGVVSTLAGLAGSGGSANGTGSAARFRSPSGVAVDSAGAIYVADTSNSIIRKITPAGVVTTLAGLAGNSGSADGTGSVARFNFPFGIAVDPNSNVIVADTHNQKIRKITPAGVVTTLAQISGVCTPLPKAIAADSSGNIYVADSVNNSIIKITSAGDMNTFAGGFCTAGSFDGMGTGARFSSPTGIAVDAAGNIFVSDTENHTVRKINPAFATVRTLAGFPGAAGNTEGNGTFVRFNRPRGIAINGAGSLYVADSNNFTIRIGGPPPVPSNQTFTSTDLPKAVFKSSTNSGQTTVFHNLPDLISASASIDITHPTPGDLKVIIFPGEVAPITGRAPEGVPQFLLWDHDPLVDAAGQPVTHVQGTVALPFSINGQPFLGADTYTVQVFDDTAPESSQVIGSFNSSSFTSNPNNSGHIGPPTVSLQGGPNSEPVPAQIDFGDPLTLFSGAIGNPSSFKIQRLGIVITELPVPTLPDRPVLYRSNVYAEPASSNSGLHPPPYLPPGLPPANYQIATTALDSAGISQTLIQGLTVIRRLGFSSIVLNGSLTHENADFTKNFVGQLRIQNDAASNPGDLRIRLLEVAVSSFTERKGPADLTAYPALEPAEMSIGPVIPLNPGMFQDVNISGKVRAPIETIPSEQYVNFQIFAVLDQNVGGEWLAIDSVKVVDGVEFHARDFGGPGGGVNEPPPNFGGSGNEPLLLGAVSVAGPDYVLDSLPAQFFATAQAIDIRGNIVKNDIGVTTYSQWTASMFSITSAPSPTPAPSPLPSPTPFRTGGLFQAGHVNPDKAVQITARFTLGGKTVLGTKSIIVLQNPLQSITRRSSDGHIILQGPNQQMLPFKVQASSAPQNFTTIGTVTVNANGTLVFEDPNPGNKRFYRLVYP